MNIWLITVGEPLPTDEGNNRLLRTGILANLLVKDNHNVVWWSSTFDHTQKEHRFLENKSIQLEKNFKLILLHSIAYQSNISIQRLINHYGIAQQFKNLAKSESKPDIILCSLPTLELSLEATQYGKKYNVPVVLDIRDLWPDIFVDIPPKYLKGITKILLFPLFRMLIKSCQDATNITGITKEFVQWGLNVSKRKISKNDQYFSMAYLQVSLNKQDLLNARNFWSNYGLTNNFENKFIICFFGSISHQSDLETIIRGAIELRKIDSNIIFVLCGKGDKLQLYKELAKGYDNIIFPGWIKKPEILSLMELSSLGITPYYSVENYTKNLPNKPIEYLSAGLPIVSSLKGVLENLLVEYNCGVTYDNGDSKQLAKIIVDLYNNPSQLQLMSYNAKKLYEQKFVAEKVYGNMIDYLEEIALCHKQTT